MLQLWWRAQEDLTYAEALKKVQMLKPKDDNRMESSRPVIKPDINQINTNEKLLVVDKIAFVSFLAED